MPLCCLRHHPILSENPDAVEAEHLLEKSFRRITFLSTQTLDKNNVDFLFEGAYESCREAAQALMSLQGFKPYSHEATISFLKETNLFTENELHTLDRFRRLRNDAIYKAVTILAIDANEALLFAKRFIKKVNSSA